jgi:hypothetical protein
LSSRFCDSIGRTLLHVSRFQGLFQGFRVSQFQDRFAKKLNPREAQSTAAEGAEESWWNETLKFLSTKTLKLLSLGAVEKLVVPGQLDGFELGFV